MIMRGSIVDAPLILVNYAYETEGRKTYTDGTAADGDAGAERLLVQVLGILPQAVSLNPSGDCAA
jgi:hypothetical protein